MQPFELTDKEKEAMIRDLRYVNKFYLADPTPVNIRALRINNYLVEKLKKELPEDDKIRS